MSALRDWRPLAKQGDANAQYRLGALYSKGQGPDPRLRQIAAMGQKGRRLPLRVEVIIPIKRPFRV